VKILVRGWREEMLEHLGRKDILCRGGGKIKIIRNKIEFLPLAC